MHQSSMKYHCKLVQHFFFIFIAMISIAVILIITSMIWLFAISKITQRTKETGTASIGETFHNLGNMERASLLLEFVDIVTDFLFAVDLILDDETKNASFYGWAALMTGIVGIICFYIKFLLMRKFIGFQCAKLKKELKQNIDD